MHNTHRRRSGFTRCAAIGVIAAAGFSLAACSSDGSSSTDSSSVTSSSTTSTSAEQSSDDKAATPSEEDSQAADKAAGGPAGWAAGDWSGHGRSLKIQPDGTGKFVGYYGAMGKDYDATVTVDSVNGDASNGTIMATVKSIEPQGNKYDDMLKPGTPITFTVEDGVATDSVIKTAVCDYDSPAYKATHSDRTECGA